MSETTAEYRVKNKNRDTRNELASYGFGILKRAVLLVLYETDQPYLRYEDIHEALELPRIREVEGKEVKDYLVHGILLRLREAELVKVVGERAEFQITEKGISLIDRTI